MIAGIQRDWDRILARLTVYSFAVVMDAVLASLLFVCVERAKEMAGSSLAVGAVVAIWAGTYMFSSLTAGRILTRRNVGWVLTGSCLGVSLLSAAYIGWSGLTALYVITALQGVATGFFFTPFQLFMKLVDEGQNKGVARSSGLYVFSWSLGYAIGPFMAAYLWRYGWRISHLVNMVACAGIALGAYLVKHHAAAAPRRPGVALTDGMSAPALVEEGGANGDVPAYYRVQNLAWMAWVFSGIGCMLTSMIRGQFQCLGESHGVSTLHQGLTLCLMSGTQAIIGLLLGWGRTWMYRPGVILAFGVFGAAGLTLFARGDGIGWFWPAAMCVGVYSGSFYVYFVYHSLVHPTHGAWYVAINEVSVGLGGMAGPALGGLLGREFGLAVPFAVGAAMIAVAVSTQAGVHFAYNRRAKAASLPAGGGYDTPHERD